MFPSNYPLAEKYQINTITCKLYLIIIILLASCRHTIDNSKKENETMFKHLYIPAIALVLASGCSKKVDNSPKQPDYINAVIMSNANLYCVIDVQAAHNTPWNRFLTDRKSELNLNDLQSMINQYTGINIEDIDTMALCFRSDDNTFIMAGRTNNPSLGFESIRGSIGIRLLKPVTLTTIKTALTTQPNATDYTNIEEISMLSMPTLKATAKSSTNSAIFMSLAGDTKTLFLSMNEASHNETLARVSGTMQQLDPALKTEIAAMPKTAQTKLVIAVPESVRKNIRERIAEAQKSTQKGPGMGFGAGLMKPFQNLQNLGLSVQTSTNLELCIYGNLGTETEASQTATLLQSLIIPLISMALNAQTQKNGGPMIEITDYLNVSSTGSTLRLNLNINTNSIDLLNMAKMLSPAINMK